MKNINLYITEKYKLSKKSIEKTTSYICFINGIEVLDYKVFYDRESLLNFLESHDYDSINFIVKANSSYEDDIIENERKRISLIKKTNVGDDIYKINKESNSYLHSINAIALRQPTINVIQFLKNNKTF